ncbi:MAG: hypothetical protein ABL907_21720, partial [Hyphomicrobium sp.]
MTGVAVLTALTTANGRSTTVREPMVGAISVSGSQMYSLTVFGVASAPLVSAMTLPKMSWMKCVVPA